MQRMRVVQLENDEGETVAQIRIKSTGRVAIGTFRPTECTLWRWQEVSIEEFGAALTQLRKDLDYVRGLAGRVD